MLSRAPGELQRIYTWECANSWLTLQEGGGGSTWWRVGRLFLYLESTVGPPCVGFTAGCSKGLLYSPDCIILYKGLEHPWILVSAGAPENNALGILPQVPQLYRLLFEVGVPDKIHIEHLTLKKIILCLSEIQI